MYSVALAKASTKPSRANDNTRTVRVPKSPDSLPLCGFVFGIKIYDISPCRVQVRKLHHADVVNQVHMKLLEDGIQVEYPIQGTGTKVDVAVDMYVNS
jgi:hypothetical protein